MFDNQEREIICNTLYQYILTIVPLFAISVAKFVKKKIEKIQEGSLRFYMMIKLVPMNVC